MHPDTKEIAKHMRKFGCLYLAAAVSEAIARAFSESLEKLNGGFSVMHASHAAEIIIKGRIAQEHPLLIFESLPKSTTTPGLLTINELLAGKTIQYSDLPEILWAVTGYRMEDIKRFQDFGKLRNTIIHFAIPDKDLSRETLKFAFEIVEPMLKDFWNDSVITQIELLGGGVVELDDLQNYIEAYNINILPYTRKLIDELDERYR